MTTPIADRAPDDAPEKSVCVTCGAPLLRYLFHWFGAGLGGGYDCPRAATQGGLHVAQNDSPGAS